MSELPSILRALADVSPSADELAAQILDVTSDGRRLAWLGVDVDVVGLFDAKRTTAQTFSAALGSQLTSSLGLVDNQLPVVAVPDHASGAVAELATLDQLHRDERLLHAGWVFLCGPAEVGGRPVRLLHPLLQQPVRAPRAATRTILQRSGDHRITQLSTTPQTFGLERPPLGPREVTASATVAPFERTAPGWHPFEPAPLPPSPAPSRWAPRLSPPWWASARGRQPSPTFDEQLRDWVERVVTSAGFGPVPLLPPQPDLAAWRDGDELVAVVGVGIYLARATHAADIATSLANWSTTGAIDQTAGAHVLTPGSARIRTGRPRRRGLPSPLVLTSAQHDARRRARHDPVTVVTGPPGSGKSHTVVAVALDAVARGERVLVATPTSHAADALASVLGRQPGPPPVLFGGSTAAWDLAAELADETSRQVSDDRLQATQAALAAAVARTRRTASTVRALLTDEQRAARAGSVVPLLPVLIGQAPGVADAEADLAALGRMAAIATTPRAGPWGRWRRRRAERTLRTRLDADDRVPVDDLARAVDAMDARRRDAALRARGGTAIGQAWDQLWWAEDQARLAAGTAMSDLARSGAARSARARAAVGALARSLRTDRAVRRQLLARLDGSGALDALPLWVGSLDDVDDLLPATPALFDLVILDEANQVDLPRAATAWLRGRRTVVVGDPAQLRHVSFVSDDAVQQAFWRHGAGLEAARLDVRRVSALDAATTVAAPQWLDEHHRSVPHLIELSARHFYQRPIHVATRHPRNERLDAIEVLAAPGHRQGRTVPDEVDVVHRQVRQLADLGWTSVGVMSPFRAQADALEAMLLDRFGLDEIERLDLRVGTVHAFQGAERDAVVLSLGLVPEDPPGRRRFVEQPDLFNVMVTRARHHLTVVHSLVPDEAVGEGLVANLLRHAHQPPAPPRDDPCDHRWTAAVAAELEALGFECRTDYPVGRWTVDLVAIPDDDPERAAAIETRVHPGGPGPHIDRHLQLRRAGWRILEAWPTAHDDDPVRAAFAVAHDLGPDRR